MVNPIGETGSRNKGGGAKPSGLASFGAKVATFGRGWSELLDPKAKVAKISYIIHEQESSQNILSQFFALKAPLSLRIIVRLS